MVVPDHFTGAKLRRLTAGATAMAKKVGSSISSGRPSGGLKTQESPNPAGGSEDCGSPSATAL